MDEYRALTSSDDMGVEMISCPLSRQHAFIAQLVERFVYTEDVGGSSPSGGTIH
jgi:hypothetical protein